MMRCYRVTAGSINIHTGVLVLSPAQADARRHRLTPLGGDRYDVRDAPVSFKRGEVFELEGELPKAIVEGSTTEGFSQVCEEGPRKEPKPPKPPKK